MALSEHDDESSMLLCREVPSRFPFNRPRPTSKVLSMIEKLNVEARKRRGAGIKGDPSEDGWFRCFENQSQVPKRLRIKFVHQSDQLPVVPPPLPHTFKAINVPQLRSGAEDPNNWHGSLCETVDYSFPDAQQPLRLLRPHQPADAQAQLQREAAGFRFVKHQARWAFDEKQKAEYIRIGKLRQKNELSRLMRTIKKKQNGQKPPCRRGINLAQRIKKKEKFRLRLAAEGKVFHDGS